MSLDEIVRQSLLEFGDYIDSSQWYGKEHEAVSLYTFGFLLNHCRPNSVLYDPKQIGIEVRVPQTRLDKKMEICKDLIVWSQPNMNCWNKNRASANSPLAILEWKADQTKIFAKDREWLLEFSKGKAQFFGYAITLDLRKRKFLLRCTRIHNNGSEDAWLDFKGK